MQHFESEIFLLQHGVDLHGDGVVNIRNHWSLLQHGRHLMYMELWIPAAACTDNHWFLLQHGLHLHGVVNTRRCQHGQPLVLVTAWTALTWSCEYQQLPARTTTGPCSASRQIVPDPGPEQKCHETRTLPKSERTIKTYRERLWNTHMCTCPQYV